MCCCNSFSLYVIVRCSASEEDEYINSNQIGRIEDIYGTLLLVLLFFLPDVYGGTLSFFLPTEPIVLFSTCNVIRKEFFEDTLIIVPFKALP